MSFEAKFLAVVVISWLGMIAGAVFTSIPSFAYGVGGLLVPMIILTYIVISDRRR